MRNNVFQLGDVKDSLMSLRTNGVKRGEWVGLPTLSEYYSMKKGSTTYIYAGAHAGKSQFTWEMIMNVAQYSGWKFAIYSPETGSPAEVFSELLWVYLRKPFLAFDEICATDEEVRNAIAFVEKHFFIIDSGLNSLTIEGFYTAVGELEESTGLKMDGCVIDPFTELTTDVMSGQREDLAIGNVLTKVRKYSSEHKVHTIISVHTKYIQSRIQDGISFIPKPTYNDIAGGQMWSRKGMMMISVWRCPFGVNDPNGVPYAANQVEITITKAKPKIVGKLGTVTMFYDRLSNRYYEQNDDGSKQYAVSNPANAPREPEQLMIPTPPPPEASPSEAFEAGTQLEIK
jgi:hypothetical protein